MPRKKSTKKTRHKTTRPRCPFLKNPDFQRKINTNFLYGVCIAKLEAEAYDSMPFKDKREIIRKVLYEHGLFDYTFNAETGYYMLFAVPTGNVEVQI